MGLLHCQTAVFSHVLLVIPVPFHHKQLKMGKKQLQVKSHRLPLKRKYTIIKKMKEHKRKLARDLRRNPEKKRKKRTDHGIPNSCPFKAEILLDMEKLKKIKEAEHAAKRAEIVEKRRLLREGKITGNPNIRNIENMTQNAEPRC